MNAVKIKTDTHFMIRVVIYLPKVERFLPKVWKQSSLGEIAAGATCEYCRFISPEDLANLFERV